MQETGDDDDKQSGFWRSCPGVLRQDQSRDGHKKDPHIRVGGRMMEEGVMRAKMIIIGKGGNTIRRVMAETNCRFHFQDSNRSNPNQVNRYDVYCR